MRDHSRTARALAVALSSMLPALAAHAAAPECATLFDGKSLAGWSLLGPAEVTVEDDVIVGRAVDSRDNSFLRTDRQFADFDLTIEFALEAGVFNSGVQFRSAQYAEPTLTRYHAFDNAIREITWSAGRVWGYQAEIDPSSRAWTGEIHDEGARGWLDTFTKSPVAIAIEPARWYTLRIRAEGTHIQTWLDGRPVADLEDDARSEGFVALQVHGIREPEQIGKAVRFRNPVLCEL